MAAGPVIYNCPTALYPNVSCRCNSGTWSGGCCSSILGSADGTQTMNSEWSTIVMGTGNTIDFAAESLGCYNAIVNGCYNTISGYTNFIGDGKLHTIDDVITAGTEDRIGANAIVNGYKSCIIQSIGSFIGSGGEHWICFGYTNVIAGGDLDAPQIKKLAEEVISKIPEPEAKKKNDEAFKHLMPEILKKHTAGKNIETKKAVAPKSKK